MSQEYCTYVHRYTESKSRLNKCLLCITFAPCDSTRSYLRNYSYLEFCPRPLPFFLQFPPLPPTEQVKSADGLIPSNKIFLIFQVWLYPIQNTQPGFGSFVGEQVWKSLVNSFPQFCCPGVTLQDETLKRAECMGREADLSFRQVGIYSLWPWQVSLERVKAGPLIYIDN